MGGTLTWLVWGPLAVEMAGSPAAWPWPWPLFRAAHPGLARFRFALEVTTAAQAGQAGPLRKDGVRYVGPGFEVIPAEGGYQARVETPVAAMGALAAALVDRSVREPFAIAHAALLAVGDCGVLAAGPSGAGKSTLAARAGRRALGSNAVLLWGGAEVWALPLPLTGRGDAAVGVRAVRLVGAWMPGVRPKSTTEAGLVARWSGVLAAAVGGSAPLERAWWLARRVRARWRGGQYLSQTSDGVPGLARPPQEA